MLALYQCVSGDEKMATSGRLSRFQACLTTQLGFVQLDNFTKKTSLPHELVLFNFQQVFCNSLRNGFALSASEINCGIFIVNQ